jgi:hypothetical protein
LLPDEVAQLKQLGRATIGIPHEDVISKVACGSLIEHDLAMRTVHFYAVTEEGLRWLRCAEIEVSK